MKAYLINMHLLVPKSRSSAKVKFKYKGYISQKIRFGGIRVLQTHLVDFTNTSCLKSYLKTPDPHVPVNKKKMDDNSMQPSKDAVFQGDSIYMVRLFCIFFLTLRAPFTTIVAFVDSVDQDQAAQNVQPDL